MTIVKGYTIEPYANLSGTNLSGADLSRADLSGANLSRNQNVIALGLVGGWTAFGWERKGQLCIRIGCREFTYAEARKHWDGRENRVEQQIATAYLRQMALARGWEV